MKIVINRCHGRFSLSEQAYKALGLENAYDEIERNDERLVTLVEKDAQATSGFFARLEVVNIPEEATDWIVNEYDGLENIIYVLNGKLYFM